VLRAIIGSALLFEGERLVNDAAQMIREPRHCSLVLRSGARIKRQEWKFFTHKQGPWLDKQEMRGAAPGQDQSFLGRVTFRFCQLGRGVH
jgi:hypothetical protein